MTDTELAALTALFNQQSLEMHDVNQDRLRNGFAIAYDGVDAWPERDALVAELKLRAVIPNDAGTI